MDPLVCESQDFSLYQGDLISSSKHLHCLDISRSLAATYSPQNVNFYSSKFIMNDQTFQPHTPSFGDDEFDIGTIGLMNCPPPDESHHQHALYSTHHSHLGVQDHSSLYAIQPSMYMQHQQAGQNHHQDGSYVLQTLESHNLGSVGNNPMNTWSPARNMQPSAPSPMDPHVASPSNDTSEDSGDDSTPVVHVQGTKRPSPEPNDAAAEAGGRTAAKKGKPQQQKKKKRRDPHEPQKPVSAYALFFRDTQAAIKGQNPNASFGEVSKIVASMWDALDAESKNIYKRKTEAAKKEYLKALAAYRASVVSKGGNGNASNDAVFPSATPPNGNSTNYPNYQPSYALNQHYNTTVPSSVAAAPQQQPPSPMAKKTPLLTSLMSEQQQQQQQKVQQANVMQNYATGKTYMNQGQPQQIMMQATAQHIHHPSIQQMANFPAHMQQQQPQQQHQQQQQQQQHMSNVHQSTQSHVAHMTVNSKHGSANLHNQLCIRAGCPNAAISSPDWENEYCSNECVVNHCRDVFSAWVAANPNAPTGYPAPVK